MEQDAKRMLLEYNRETKRLDDLYRCAAKQCGISECAFWILYTLRAEERQFTQAEICEFLIEPKQTIHSALKKLEAEGYLARTSGADLRSKRVALTEKGEQFARAWIDRVLEAEAAALCAMPDKADRKKESIFREYVCPQTGIRREKEKAAATFSSNACTFSVSPSNSSKKLACEPVVPFAPRKAS